MNQAEVQKNLDQAMLISVVWIDRREGQMPTFTQLIAGGNEELPAVRQTVVTPLNESPESHTHRIAEAVRALKTHRGLMHHVLAHCFYDDVPVNVVERDNRWNLWKSLWHQAEHHRSGVKRVRALCQLVDMLDRRSQSQGTH